MKICIYPGSFDPVTKGHLDIISRIVHLFDRVYVVVMHNGLKNPLFSVSERRSMLVEITREFPCVVVDSYAGLVVNYAKEKGAQVLIRGLRAVSDFEFEFKLAAMNRSLAPSVETLFLMPCSEYSFISSSSVKEVASLGGDVSRWVCPIVEASLYDKFGLGKGER